MPKSYISESLYRLQTYAATGSDLYSPAMQFRPEIIGVKESPMIQVAALAESLPDVVKVCYGESDSPTPEFICRAAYEGSLAGHTGYTHTAGSREFREAIGRKFFELQGVQCG